jgi:hypothetical protein
VILFGLIGWWRGRGVRITDGEGHSVMGSQGALTFFFTVYFPCQSPLSLIVCWFEAEIIYILQLGMNFDLIRSNSTVLHVFPFNSEKKRGGVALKLVIIWSKYLPIHHFIHWANLSYKSECCLLCYVGIISCG